MKKKTPSSLHKSQGWKSQWLRLGRWHERVQKIGNAESTYENSECQHDDVYAFFMNCYHLRDWLTKSEVVDPKELSQFFKYNRDMGLCRDICNGLKHLNISRPSIDADFSFGREYVPANAPGYNNERLFIFADGKFLDIFDLADRCVWHWQYFLSERGLS